VGGRRLIFDRAQRSGEICGSAVPSWKCFFGGACNYVEEVGPFEARAVGERLWRDLSLQSSSQSAMTDRPQSAKPLEAGSKLAATAYCHTLISNSY
jgi:hypothetical protein